MSFSLADKTAERNAILSGGNVIFKLLWLILK